MKKLNNLPISNLSMTLALIVAYLLSPNIADGQCPDETNNFLEKYWATREFFDDNLILNAIDEETGELLNDGIGYWDEDCKRYSMAGYGIPANEINSTPDNNSSHSLLNWGDAMIRIGRYIPVLCTEYELFRQNEQHEKKKKALNHLFLALQAIRRVDMTANRLYERYLECHEPACPWTANLSGYSGFFIRDDVPVEFEDHFSPNGSTLMLSPIKSCQESPEKSCQVCGNKNEV
jgi:hypothetical protein